MMLTDALGEVQQAGLNHDIPWIILVRLFGVWRTLDRSRRTRECDSVAVFSHSW